MRRALVRSAAVVGCVGWMARNLGCDPASTSGIPVDTDGDGLNDVDERMVYGTSPVLADTDGDGINDYAEIVTNVFDPLTAPLRFNPRVADVPLMEVEIISPPLVSLRLIDINGEARTFEVLRMWQDAFTVTESATAAVTDTNTFGESDTLMGEVTFSREDAITREFPAGGSQTGVAGASGGSDPSGGAGDERANAGNGGSDAGRDASAVDSGDGQRRGEDTQREDGNAADGNTSGGGGGADGSESGPIMVTMTVGRSATNGFSFTVNRSTSTQVSLSFTEQQARQFLESLTLAQAYEQSHQIQASGGVMEVLAVMRNRSNVPFQVTNLMLAASLLTPSGLEMPIGNLDYQHFITSFQPFSIAPGQEIGPLNFQRDELTLEQVAALLQNMRGIILRVGVYELSDANEKPYAFDVPAIRSRTATIEINYGSLRPPERHLVATNLDPGRPGVTARQALGEILRIPFVCEEDRGVISVRGVAAADMGGHWCLYHHRRVDGAVSVTSYCDDETSFDCSRIELRAGDLLRLRWIER